MSIYDMSFVRAVQEHVHGGYHGQFLSDEHWVSTICNAYASFLPVLSPRYVITY